MPWYLNNSLLVLLFVAQHSVGTIESAKNIVAKLTGGRRFLWNFIYSLTTVVIMAVMIKYWKSTDDVVWSVSPAGRWALYGVQAACVFVFFFLFRFTQPFGEWLGTSQVARMLKGDPEPTKQGYQIKKIGIKKYVRFPHHTVLIVMFWALPTMTTDLLVLALQSTVYLWLGSAHQDMRGKSYFEEQWLEYRKSSRMLFPAVENVWTDLQTWWRQPARESAGARRSSESPIAVVDAASKSEV